MPIRSLLSAVPAKVPSASLHDVTPSARPSARPSVRPGRTGVRRGRGVSAPRSRLGNMLLGGGGAETLQDRGSLHTASHQTLHPYYNNNCPARWQEYVRWYMTSWEARKIIDIPVDDALRKPVELRGLKREDAFALEEAGRAFELDRKIRRALVQERLLGGAVLFPLLLRPEGESLEQPFDSRGFLPGDLQAVNLLDVSRLSRPEFDPDPFSPGFDTLDCLTVDGRRVHVSRLYLLDGGALFARGSQNLLQGWRMNPCGFGESRLAPLYDLLKRVIGTQQGAFHLVNMASCLLVEVDNLRSVLAVNSPATTKLREIVEQLSLYRGAVIDAKGARVTQHAAAFGSVPELVMTFAQLLSAASDIPATRFLGQAPGGLNATGESDQANYYDMVASFQRQHLMPLQRRCLDWLGLHLWGWQEWQEKSRTMQLVYPSLKTLDAGDEGALAKTYADLLKGLCDSGILDKRMAVRELLERKVFCTQGEADDFLLRAGATDSAHSENNMPTTGKH